MSESAKMNRRVQYDVLHQPWKARPWVVVCKFPHGPWEQVSHHATEGSALEKMERMIGSTP